MAEGSSGEGREGRGDAAFDQWVHRQALQLIGLLPDDFARATAILERAKFLMECWSLEPKPRTAEIRLLRPERVSGSAD